MSVSALKRAPSIEAMRPARVFGRRGLFLLWSTYVVGALLLLSVLPLTVWGLAMPAAALALVAVTAPAARHVPWFRRRTDPLDLAVVAGLYITVVALYRLAFVVFTADRVLGLFLCFAGALILGVAGPTIYSTWVRGRPLRSLGVGGHQLRTTLTLAVVFGGVQFAIMFWGRALPAPVDWVPLLVMSLTVGLFEAVFFRGFIQGRLEDSFGAVPAVAGAAILYALYHVGYGMGGSEMVFLFGLGVVYAIAYRLVDNILVLWPLLTPLGAFFNNLQAGDVELPWASIAGFVDVLGVMAAVWWLANRHHRRVQRLENVSPSRRTSSRSLAAGVRSGVDRTTQ